MNARRLAGSVLGVAALLCALGAAAVMSLSVRVDGSSMEPTLQSGTRLLPTPDSEGEARRFDVVLLRPTGRNALLVKRVIGLAGDRVGIASTPEDPFQVLLQVGGTGPTYRVTFPAWTAQARRTGNCCAPGGTRSAEPQMRTVPPGMFFFLGDNPDESDDSRMYGWGELERVSGRVGLRVWPASGPRDIGARPRMVEASDPRP